MNLQLGSWVYKLTILEVYEFCINNFLGTAVSSVLLSPICSAQGMGAQRVGHRGLVTRCGGTGILLLLYWTVFQYGEGIVN